MAADKTCVLFDGGKRIKLATDTNPGNEGIKMVRNQDGSWNITLNARISANEAKNVIFMFDELKPGSQEFESAFPNMIYFPVNNEIGTAKPQPALFGSELIPAFDRDLGGTINVVFKIAGSGKTQNVKTQNIHVGNPPH